MTAPDELETTLLEWAKGPYQMSVAECRVVMARLVHVEELVDAWVEQASKIHAENNRLRNVFVHPGAGKDCGLCHPPEVRNVPQDDPFNPPPATTENP